MSHINTATSSVKQRWAGIQEELGPENYENHLVHSVEFFTSSAAEDLRTQVEGVSELNRDDAQVASSDEPTEPAGHRGPAHHPHLKHLQHKQEDTALWLEQCIRFFFFSNMYEHSHETFHHMRIYVNTENIWCSMRYYMYITLVEIP